MATSTISRPRSMRSSLNGVSLIGNKNSYTLKIGTTAVWGTVSNTAVATSKNVNVGSITLTTGTWLIMAGVRYPANNTGKRGIGLNTGIASDGSQTWLNGYGCRNEEQTSNNANSFVSIGNVHIVTASSQTVYVNAYQTSGTSLTINGGYVVAYKL